jgi:hypothetical protein
MHKLFKPALIVLIGLLFTVNTYAQDDDHFFDQFFIDTALVENPVYMPVIGIGPGYFNFFGEVQNSSWAPLSGNVGGKIHISMYADKKHTTRVNFNIIIGELKGRINSPDTLAEHNLNFKTTLAMFGAGVEYNFGHFIKGTPKVMPFISVGANVFNYSPKGDLKTRYNGKTVPYHYWDDGTIRPESQNSVTSTQPPIIKLDGDYESDLRSLDLYDQGQYSQLGFSIAADAGVDFVLSPRTTLRFGTAFHYTFTDNIDNVSDEAYAANNKLPNKSGNDMFAFTYTTFHLDLFSSDKYKIIETVFKETDYDAEAFADEDNDRILDLEDRCLGTPYGVAVDSLGCPYDKDKDGVFDYLDKETNTKYGAPVDADGVTISDDVLHSSLFDNDAVDRDQAYMIPLVKNWTRFGANSKKVKIPEKFMVADKNKDGYISYEEIMDLIDAFFDKKTKFTADDIYELNEFFFAQ